MKQVRAFARRLDALDALVAFAERAMDGSGLDAARRQSVHFAIEELFTNMLKYSPTTNHEIVVEIVATDKGLEVTLIDTDVESFDVTRVPPSPIDLPIEQRQPGGLGLQLVRRLVDSFSYDYAAARRQARVSFVVGAAAPAAGRPGSTRTGAGPC